MEKKSESRLYFIKTFIGFSLSSWIGAALSLVSVPIKTRVFTTGELGKINLFISIVNMFLNFAYLGIDQTYSRFYFEPLGKNDKKSFMGVCLTMVGGVVLLTSIGIMLFYKQLSEQIIGYVSFIIPIAVILSIIANVLLRFFNLSARMEKNILLYNVQAVAITVIGNFVFVITGLYNPSAENAIVLRTLLFCAAAVIFLIYKSKTALSFKMDCSKPVVKDILIYSLPLCPATLLSVANSSIGQLLMKHYVDYSAVGIYSNAVTVSSIITILQQGINNYWGPYVYENYKTKQKKIIKMHHMISFAMIIAALGIILFQDLIYAVLIGKNFWGSKAFFPLLIISPVCYTISETLGIGIRLSKKTILNIPVYAINVIVNIGLCWLLLPRVGVVGAAVATAVSSVVMLIVKSIFGERLYCCSDNYLKLALALGTLLAVSFVHIYVYQHWIKYPLYLTAMAITVLCYRNEVKMLFLLLDDFKKKLIKR